MVRPTLVITIAGRVWSRVWHVSPAVGLAFLRGAVVWLSGLASGESGRRPRGCSLGGPLSDLLVRGFWAAALSRTFVQGCAGMGCLLVLGVVPLGLAWLGCYWGSLRWAVCGPEYGQWRLSWGGCGLLLASLPRMVSS